MAYLDKETKAKLDTKCKAIAKKYGIKVTTRRDNYSEIVLTIREGKIDFIENYIKNNLARGRDTYTETNAEYTRKGGYIQTNHYYLKDSFTGVALDALEELNKVLHGEGWYDRSDSMTDYFDTAWYVSIHIGDWDKPYTLSN